MAFKYTPAALKKLETLFKEAGYIVRFERGNFTSGYCVLEQKKVVVINKFFDQDARINSLLDILAQVDLDLSSLSPESAAWASELIAMRGGQAAHAKGGVAEPEAGAEPEASAEAEASAEPQASAEPEASAVPAEEAETHPEPSIQTV
jgi:hypothetical protein